MSARLGPYKLGNAQAWLTPHYVPGVGAQLILTIEGHGAHVIEGVAADEIEAFGNHCKLAACEAEAVKRRALRHERFANLPSLKASTP
jgi:hypothetical protein